MAERSDAELVLEARLGDAEAFGQLVARHWRALVRRTERVVGDHHLAQDVVQEAFVRAHRNLRTLEHNTHFFLWVMRIARNIAVDCVRAERQHPLLELAEPDQIVACDVVSEPAPADSGARERAQEAARVWSAVKSMPERERRLMVLRYARGLSQRQIAEECGLSLGHVKVALHRGRTRLAGLVATFGGAPRQSAARTA
ncbi:MAG: sigma-70 family RNA polymerase sigma factor [Planctomycetes bacterium]|nr:sigma-70 family RNA polymerase sigma factor [Planctomycetota bacterium]